MPLAASYLIQYGRPGFIGQFGTSLILARGDRVVVRGPRGTEFGEVLIAIPGIAVADGDVVRTANASDDDVAAGLANRGQDLLTAAMRAATNAALPMTFVDVEVTLDGCAILHALAWDSCDSTDLLDSLAERFGMAVQVLDLSRLAASREPGGCGKPDCGRGSGGCSTCGTGGGCSTCSRGSVLSGEDLTSYFAELRQRMEAARDSRTPLN